MRYTVVLVPEPEAGGFVAYVPVIPNCVTQGETVEEALAMAHDAATLLLESMADHDEEIPVEPAGALVAGIEIDVPTSARVAA